MFTDADALALIAPLRAAGKTVVFTNGVFDLLHPGHLRYLRRAGLFDQVDYRQDPIAHRADLKA